MKTPTVTSVRAKIKRAAAAEGFYLKLVHSKGREWRDSDLRVGEGYASQARDAGLKTWRDLDRKQGLADWLREVLTAEELRTVLVTVEVSNSDPMTDYFDIRWERVLPDWESYVRFGSVSTGWAKDLLGVDEFGSMYDRGTRRFTRSEVAALAPSEAHAWALAFLITHGVSQNSTVIEQLTKLNDAGRSLFEVMLPNWNGGVLYLLEAVAALIPQEAPVALVVEPEVPVQRLTEQPQALADYLGRLIHVPKKLYASRVYAALIAGEELPESDAVWADDVLKRVRRYARA